MQAHFKSSCAFTWIFIACAHTSYLSTCLTESTFPPLQIVTWFIKTICKMRHDVLYIRVDKDKALAISSEYCPLMVDMNCILQTTGGYNSENNGNELYQY